MVWYLFKNFPQIVVSHSEKGFGVVNKAEVEVPLEKAMAPHSSALAWKIPWAEEPVGCSPCGQIG